MEKETITYEEITATVTELADMSKDEMMARGRDGRFARCIILDDGDVRWRIREVVGICWVLFGGDCAARMRAAWNIPSTPAKRRRREPRHTVKPDWLDRFGQDEN